MLQATSASTTVHDYLAAEADLYIVGKLPPRRFQWSNKAISWGKGINLCFVATRMK